MRLKQTLPPGKKGLSGAAAAASCGLLAAVALILSYLEGFLPVGALTGVPGVKLGLANIAVVVAFFVLGMRAAVCVSLLRITVSSLLFGSVTAFLFSLSGGALAFLALLLTHRLKGRFVSMIGISMLSAALHNIGQILAAVILMRDGGVAAYLPVLLIASLPCGALTGAAAELLVRAIGSAKAERGR